MIVEDNILNTKLFRALLAAGGREVRDAPHAEAALEMLDAFAPHLLVLDMQLAQMSGYDLARKLKANSETAHISILAATASAMVGDEAKALAAGCDAYITKPIDSSVFRDLVRRLLAGSASLRPAKR